MAGLKNEDGKTNCSGQREGSHAPLYRGTDADGEVSSSERQQGFKKVVDKIRFCTWDHSRPMSVRGLNRVLVPLTGRP